MSGAEMPVLDPASEVALAVTLAGYIRVGTLGGEMGADAPASALEGYAGVLALVRSGPLGGRLLPGAEYIE